MPRARATHRGHSLGGCASLWRRPSSPDVAHRSSRPPAGTPRSTAATTTPRCSTLAATSSCRCRPPPRARNDGLRAPSRARALARVCLPSAASSSRLFPLFRSFSCACASRCVVALSWRRRGVVVVVVSWCDTHTETRWRVHGAIHSGAASRRATHGACRGATRRPHRSIVPCGAPPRWCVVTAHHPASRRCCRGATTGLPPRSW